MGATISEQQLIILKKARQSYILMLDGDDTGRKASMQIAQKLKKNRIPVRTIYLMDVKEPEQLDEDYLKFVAGR